MITMIVTHIVLAITKLIVVKVAGTVILAEAMMNVTIQVENTAPYL